MKILLFLVLALSNGSVIPAGEAFLRQLQPRDSILIADQVEYGVRLDSVRKGSAIALPDFNQVSSDTLFLVRDWQLDTLPQGRRSSKDGDMRSIEAFVVLAPFEPGTYQLPDIPVGLRYPDGTIDTLVFSAVEMEVRTMPVDTSTFVIHDIKDQIRYPLTFRETVPYILGAIALAALVTALVFLLKRLRRRQEDQTVREPSYIVALRTLDKYRGDKYWAPEKQKVFYSGVTDALKVYIDDRFSIDAPEMTTAELFEALKGFEEIPADLLSDMKSLFENADFVKFAKFTADDSENARVLPVAVRFVTSTYQSLVDSEVAEEKGGEA